MVILSQRKGLREITQKVTVYKKKFLQIKAEDSSPEESAQEIAQK